MPGFRAAGLVNVPGFLAHLVSFLSWCAGRKGANVHGFRAAAPRNGGDTKIGSDSNETCAFYKSAWFSARGPRRAQKPGTVGLSVAGVQGGEQMCPVFGRAGPETPENLAHLFGLSVGGTRLLGLVQDLSCRTCGWRFTALWCVAGGRLVPSVQFRAVRFRFGSATFLDIQICLPEA